MKLRLSTCLLAVILTAGATASAQLSTEYIEDFTTTTYQDPSGTTAWWDTSAGELKLNPFDPTILGTYDTGWSLSMFVSGNYVFIADETVDFQIMDVSDPTTPALVGSYDTPGQAWGLYVAGNHAFVTFNTSGLEVIDINNVASPTMVGSYDTPGAATGIYVAGDYAYIADGGSGLQVIDVSDPTNPTLAGGYDTPSGAQWVDIVGDYAYVADAISGLQILDITTPSAPTFVGSIDTPGFAHGVHVSGEHALIADGSSGLHVVDVSDPTLPTIIGAYDTPSEAWGVHFSGDFAYVANYQTGLLVFDVSDPTNPIPAGSVDTPNYAYVVQVEGNRAYIANGPAGLEVIDVANPITPTLRSSYDTSNYARGVSVSGNYAYVGESNTGFHVFDVSDPGFATLVATYNTPGSSHELHIAGDHAYVADYSGGLQVIDISDPTSPSLAGSYASPGLAVDVFVYGDYAYLVDGNTGLQVVDVSDPTTPALAGGYDTPGIANDVFVVGDEAYVSDREAGMQVIDVSDPTAPSLVGTFATPDWANGVYVAGDYAFLAVNTYGLYIVDVGNPAAPSLAGVYDTPGNAVDVYAEGHVVVVADVGSGVHVIDVGNPSAPALMASYDTAGDVTSVHMDGDHVYAADGFSGLAVVQVFQREVDTTNDTGWSLPVDAANDSIVRARVTTTQTNTVTWELSADGGSSWQGISPGSWDAFAAPGSDLEWRSTHAWSSPGVNPTVSQLEIDWLYSFAIIESIDDIANDQGRQVRLSWTRSGYDFLGSTAPITSYAIYRKIDPLLSAQTNEKSAYVPADVHAYENVPDALPPAEWDFIQTVPAILSDSYAAVVPTLSDSTVAEGMYYTTFRVVALTATPGIFFTSYPDSGYSLDNLVPGVPQGLIVAYNTGGGTQLTWDGSQDPDFQYFRIYRSTTPDFTPSQATLVHATASTSWIDGVPDPWLYRYKVSSVDFSGNESDAASPELATSVADPTLPTAFAMRQNVPNPFNPTTVIGYDVPTAGAAVTIRIYDVGGRVVRTLVDEVESQGAKTVVWDGRDDRGQTVVSGVYLYKMTAPGYSRTLKLVLMK